MNLIFRLAWLLLSAPFKSRIAVLDESALTFVVLPNDLDANLHMNNGRYLSVMDLGRVDYLARVGLFKPLIKRGWRPVLGGATLIYRTELRPFQKYRLHTRVVCWDEKWIYMEQRFERNGKPVAQGIVKALFRSKRRALRPREVLRAIGQEMRSPHMPPAIEALRLAEGLSGQKPGRA